MKRPRDFCPQCKRNDWVKDFDARDGSWMCRNCGFKFGPMYDVARSIKAWAVFQIIGALLPLLFVGYLFISCKASERTWEADRARIDALELQVFDAQDNVIRRIDSLSQSEKLELVGGDPERIRLRTLSLCSLQMMEIDANWRNQYMDVCKALGRADRALHDEQRRQGLDVSRPSTEGF